MPTVPIIISYLLGFIAGLLQVYCAILGKWFEPVVPQLPLLQNGGNAHSTGVNCPWEAACKSNLRVFVETAHL